MKRQIMRLTGSNPTAVLSSPWEMSLQGVQDGLVDIGCTILVFEAARLPLQDMVYSMPFSCSDPLIVAETIKQMYEKYPEFTSIYETATTRSSSESAYRIRMDSSARKKLNLWKM